MKIIDKLSECEDKLLDPRTLSFRLKHPMRRKINDLLSSCSDAASPADSRQQESEAASTTAAAAAACTLKQILDQEDDDQKHLLTYDDVSEIHRSLQRLDPTYRLFFHQLLDECRAFMTEERDVSTVEGR